MAVDEVLLYSLREDNLPIFRIYRWEPSLSFGRFSKVNKSINLNHLLKRRAPYVRRPSGGGILVHGGDISYSIIMPRKLLDTRGVKENYHYLSQFLINFYKKLSLMATFASKINLNIQNSNICLAGNEAYDIVIDGKKIGGNAQRYIKSTLLQHGSIPISFNKNYFEDFFLGDSGFDNAVSLQELGVDLDYDALIGLLIESFCETFDVKFISNALELSQERDAKKLLQEKYTQEVWNIYGK